MLIVQRVKIILVVWHVLLHPIEIILTFAYAVMVFIIAVLLIVQVIHQYPNTIQWYEVTIRVPVLEREIKKIQSD